MVVRRPLLASAVASFSLLTWWAGSRWEAQAAASPAEEARQLLTAVEADAATRELVSRAVAQAHSALDRAQASAEAGTERELLEAMALEWAQSARDLQRARAAEQASDGLEQSLSTLQTELVRTRASVEQAFARVGRARQELTELERNAPGSGALKAPSSKAATSADGTPVRQAPAAKAATPADGTPGAQAPATKTPAPTKQAPASQAEPATPPPGARP